MRDEKIKLQWEEIQVRISKLFGGGETLDVDAIIYLIGVQELGQGNRKFKKDEKKPEAVKKEEDKINNSGD